MAVLRGEAKAFGCPLIPALDCDRKGAFRAALRWVWSLGGAIHQVGGRDRNIYCRVIEGNQKPEAIRLLSTCLPIRSMAAEQTAEERVGGEVLGGTQ